MKQINYYRPYRWIVLASYMTVIGVSQMIYLNFVSLMTEVQNLYGVSELLASALTVCNPLMFTLVSMPAGAMTDRKGYRFTIRLGLAIMSIFACMRIYTGSFWLLLICQIGNAIAQPFIMNGITKLAADWFAEEQRAAATGLGTAGMFAGLALGFSLPPHINQSFGLSGTMLVFAIIAIVLSLVFFLLVKENHITEPEETAQLRSFTALAEVVHIVKDRSIMTIVLMAFIAFGFFNGLTTWLEGILGQNGVGATDVGNIGGVMILAGIIGSLVIPTISDFIKRRKPVLLFCGISGIALIMPLCLSSDLPLLYLYGGLIGFLFLPGFALLLVMSEEVAGPKRAGGAAAAIMLVGNAGGVIISVAMALLKSDTSGWRPAEYFILGLLIIIFILALFTSESFRSEKVTIS
ncbi:transporter, major facilitator family protein [Leptospira broomii serovar Hurstbridge str. 5399]|uniref:Transporter, major facilitator family protein n=1 Tax=Leptospira broomii serovar Hurstbridge str. 5399 TaxID=1049789 RepID=T0FGF2_9LEPT|nr:MFS transporter [Leptospira broomii]EQA47006.1 transporter, major facilitator family protein [Leptospira broomii serovar Hurstbridge str. 5399]